MLNFTKRVFFAGKTKSSSAAHIFWVLCFYAAFTIIYGYIVVGLTEMLVRLALGIFIVLSFVLCERSRISVDIAAFLSPACILTAIYIGAIYSGDVLVFIYIIGAAMLSLTYLKPKSLLICLLYSIFVSSIILFGFKKNMMGYPYTFIHNIIFMVASSALSVIVYSFCGSYAKMIDNLVEAENKAALAAKAKGNFLARMSHEIRTPLNAIIGLTDTQLRRDLSEDIEGVFTNIQSSGKLLLGIINDILDLSKIESGKFDLVPEEYEAADIIYDIINLNIVRIGSKPLNFIIKIDPGIPSRLIGDSLRIKQLLNNLLSNAFKYTNEGTITLGLTWSLENDMARLIFTVADTGIGILPEDLDILFSEYSQVNRQANKAIEGTGLGLSICKWLAELMDGRIYAQSKFGEGSVFTAEIMQEISDGTPLGEDKATALAEFTYIPEFKAASLECQPIPYGKVLIVDDVEINLMVAAALMEPYQMRVDCVGSGFSAVDKMKSGEPEYDMILMDHMMPGMDGIETAAAIRAINTDYAKSIPIVALTANAVAGSEKMFIENGFQGFLAKPIELHQLDSILCKWVKKESLS